jgi:MYXO-CTERM domain-containing protein
VPGLKRSAAGAAWRGGDDLMNDRISRNARLTSYVALAGGVIPVAAPNAPADVQWMTGLNLMATPDNPVAVDFGPGFGELFVFSAYSTYFSSFRTSSRTDTQRHDQVVQFNTGSPNGWTAASLINYAGGFDPLRLGKGSPIGPAAGWMGMTNYLGDAHDLATSFFFLFSTPGSFTSGHGTGGRWAPDKRGYVGLRFTNDAGANYHYAWIDVGADLIAQKITIYGWGFQDTPNAPINAGQVPSPGVGGLALLAMGAAGVRRQRRMSAP